MIYVDARKIVVAPNGELMCYYGPLPLASGYHFAFSNATDEYEWERKRSMEKCSKTGELVLEKVRVE